MCNIWGIMHLRPIQVVASAVHPLLLLIGISLYGCATVFIHSLAEEHLGSFQSLIIVNRADTNIPVQVCMGAHVFISLG